MERIAMILLALVATTQAGPMQRVSIDTCAKTCTESNKFHYAPGNSYEYVYRSNVKTSMAGAGSDEAGVIMTATVNLDVLSKCELSMRLSDVKLEELDPTNTPTTDMSAGFARPLEKNPVRVSFQDGQLEHLCTTGDEPTWVLNVKRGVISLLQNNMEDFTKNKTLTESDVSGECVTNYEVAGSGWYTTTVRKSKDLLGCRGRQQYNNAVHGIPYSSDSNIQSLPIVKSELECSHDVDTQSGLLKRISCTESHVLRPFSSGGSGAITTNTQELKYLRESRGIRSPAGIYEQGVSLKFHHENNGDSEADNAAKHLKAKLLEVCQKTKAGVRPDTPALFTNLVYLVKSADADTLEVTYNLVDGNKFCADNRIRTRKFFLDALPMAGTGPALHLMTSLITKKTVTGSEADSWITSLAFIKKPTLEMLKEVKPLINMAGIGEKAMLSVGTLIHNYCEGEGAGCARDYMVTALVSAIENQMAKKCKVTPANKKMTLMALRGLGNAGYVKKTVPTLEACIDSPMVEIRLSAIDAFRRMPCNVDRSKLERVYLDDNEDSELRIAAYRALMHCPTQKLLTIVKNALDKEAVNQVGSYVWTHLTNLMETSDRHKQDIRAILEDATFKKEFDLDRRKFSRNYEGSFFLDAVNTGAKVEGDLIWSAKSFIPRSSMLNLTVDLFGHSMNLFEMGGRVEGLEYLLESFFGPSGYFSQKNTPTTKDVAPKAIHPDKMKKLDGRFGAIKDDLQGSMYMRVFGNELSYLSFDSLESLLTASDVNVLDILVQLAKDNDYTYTHSSMFLDSSIIIPTSSGFPLNLTINGTSTVDLRMKGKMDLRTPPHIVIDGLIQPSAAIDISTMMSVDAFVTRPGIKMVSTLHSSTAVQGKVLVKEDGSMTAEYDMPQPKMEIIDVKTSFFTIHTNQEREQKLITDNRQTVTSCSPRHLAIVTGLEICSEVTYPNASAETSAPYFPFTGPVSAGVYLYKRDTHTKYTMNIKSIHNKNKNVVHFSVDTPGSRTNRHILGDITLNKFKNTVDLTLKSPWTSADIQGTYTSEKGLNGIMGKMSIDGQPGYVIDAKVVRDRVKNAYRYTPSLDITVPKRKPIAIQGMLMFNGNRQFDVEFSMKGVTVSPIAASATITNRPVLLGLKASLELVKGNPYSIDASVSTQNTKKKVVYKPFLSVRSPTSEVLAFGGTVSHMYNKKFDWNLVLDKVVAKKVTTKGFVSMLAKRRGRTIYRTVVKATSEPADFNLDLKIDNRNYRIIATDFDFTYVIRRIARNNIKLVSKIQNLSSTALKKGKATLNLAVKRNPELNLKMLGNVNHNKKHTDMDLDLRYGDNFKNEQKHLDFAFEMNRKFKGVMDASGDISTRLRHPGMGLNVMMKGDHKHTERDLDTNVELRFGKGAPIQSSLRMWERWEQRRMMSSEFNLNYPGRQLVLNQTVQEPVADKMVSVVNVQLQKGQKNAITTTFDWTKTDNLRVMSDWLLHGQTPTHLEGEFQMNTMDFITSVTMLKDSKKYAGSLKSKTVEGLTPSSNMIIDVEYPARQVILDLGGKVSDEAVQGKADLMWNAAANSADRITLQGWIKPPTAEALNGSLTLSYPGRTLILNGNFRDGKKTSAYADFQWDVDQKISAETTLGITAGSIFGSGMLVTPFPVLKKLNVEFTHNNDRDEYKTDLKVTRNAGQSVSLTTVLKKPISLHTFVAYFATKNNFAKIKNLRLDIDHKLSNSLASSGKFKWNKQQIQAEVVLQNTSKPGKTGVKGNINIKTTMKAMKKASLEFFHFNNGRIFNTMAKAVRNKRAYSVQSKITHTSYANKYENVGTVDVSIPTEKYYTSWSHTHSLLAGKIDTTYSTKWGKKQQSAITMKFDAGYKNAFDTTFKLETPFKAVRSVQLMSSLTQEETAAGGKFNLMKDDQLVAASDIGYELDDSMAKARATLEIPDLDVDSSLQAQYDNTDMSATYSAVIMPEMTASLEFKSGLVLWKSTYPGAEQIRYTYAINDGKQLVTTHNLEYGVGKVIRLHTRLQMDHEAKRVFCELTTPSKSLTKFSTGLNFVGDLESFTSDAFIEMHPGFDKISASASYNSKVGVSGNLRVDTPFEDLRYFKVDFSGKLEAAKDAISVQVEYQPSKIVKFELEGERDAVKSSMSAKVSVPDNTISVEHKVNRYSVRSSAALVTSGNKYEVDLDHTNAQKLNTILTVTMPNRRPIILTFSHEGDLLDFKTRAEVQHNRKNTFASDISFKSGNTLALTTRTTLQSEMISGEEYTVVGSYRCSAGQLSSHAELASSSLGKSTADISLTLGQGISGSLALQSPHMKNIKASVSHFNQPGFLETKADLIRGGKKLVNLDASLKSDQSVVGEFSLKQPFKMLGDVQALVRFDGVSDSFAVHGEGSIGDKKAEVEYISQLAPSAVQQTITVKATGIRDLTAELSLSKTSEYKGYGEFKYGSDKHRVDVGFRNLRETEGSFSLTSPLVDPVTANFNIQGGMQSFRSSAGLSLGQEKSEVLVEFQVSPTLKGSLSVNSPYMFNSAASFEHNGELPNIVSKAKISYGKEMLDGEFTMATTPKLSTSFTLRTTNPEMSTIQASINHEGIIKNFMTNAYFSLGQKKSQMQVAFQTSPNAQGSLSVTSPYIYNLDASFEHKGVLPNIVSKAKMSYGMEMLDGEFTMSSAPKLSTSFTVLTSQSHLPRIHASISHEETATSLTSHGEYSLGQYGESNVDLSLRHGSSLEGLLTVTSNLIPDLSASFEHSGPISDFRSSAEVIFDSETHKGAVSFSNKKDVDAHFDLSSPMFDTVEGNVHHCLVRQQAIECHADIKLGSDKSNGDFAHMWSQQTVESSFSLTTPKSQPFKVTFNHDGPIKNFVTKAEIMNGGELSAGTLSFDLGSNSLTTSIIAKAPQVNLIMNLNHNSQPKKFTTHGDMTIDGSRAEFNVNVNILDSADVSLTVSAPDLDLKINHNGHLPNFASSAALTSGTNVYSAGASLRADDDIAASISMASPITDFESFKATYMHTYQGSMNHFKCHMEVETPSRSSVSDLVVNGKGTTLDVSNPKVTIKFLYDIVPDQKLEVQSEFTALDLSYASTVMLEKEATAMRGNIEMRSPIEGDHLKLSASLSKPTQFEKKAFLELVLNDDHNEVEATLTTRPQMAAALAVRTVYFPHMDVSADVSGSPSNFQASSEILLNGDSKGKVETEFDMVNQKHASLTLRTPFTNFTSLNMDTVFNIMDLSNIDTSFTFTLEGDKLADAGMKFTYGAIVQGDAHFNSIYLHPTSATFRLEKEGVAHQANMKIDHANEPLFSSVGKLTYLDNLLNSDGSIKVVVYEMDPVEVVYSMENSPEHLKYHLETTVSKDKYEADTAATNNNKITEASFSVKMPNQNPVSGSASYKKKFSRYILQAELELDSVTKYEGAANLQTRNGLNGKMTISTPVEGWSKTTASLTHTGTFPNINSAVSATSGRKTMSASVDMSHAASRSTATMKLASPFESLENIEATLYREGSWSNLKAGGKLSYTTGEAIEVSVEHMLFGTTLKSKISLTSPYTNEISVSANHNGDWDDFTSDYSLTMGPDNGLTTSTSFKTSNQYLVFTNNLLVTMTGKTTLKIVALELAGQLDKFRTQAKLQSDANIIKLDTAFQLKPVIEGTVELISPFTEDMKIEFSHSGNMKAFLTKGEVQYAPQKKVAGKLDVLIHDLSRMDITAEVTTPFAGYETSKVTYHHSGSTDSLQCEASVLAASQELSSTLTAKLSPPSAALNIKTPFTGYTNMDAKFNINNNARLGRFGGRFEGSWAPSKTIVAEVSVSDMHHKLEGNAILSTPFAIARRASFEFSHQILQGSLMQMVKASLNGQSLVDVETDFNVMTEHKHGRVIMHAPVSMKYEMEGDFTLKCVDVDATANLNTKETGKTYKAEFGYDLRADSTAHFKLTGQGHSIAYKGQFLSRHISSELSLDLTEVTGLYGFDISPTRNGGIAKVMLPSRTLALSGTMRSRVTEGSFMWDADRDESKKVELRSVIVPTRDSVKMDVTLRMPSLGKQVQVGSEVVVNRGTVIFEGKTELSYSADERQKLLLSTKLEDVSSGNTKNYSFSMGVSHPYSTVGIKLASHIGKSVNKYSAGMGLEYLTARRQTKTFQVNGIINKLRKTAKFELQSPVKSISIASSVQTGKQFEVTLTNTYDTRQPLHTTLTINPANKAVSFSTNYDLDNPRDSFNMNLGYINSQKWEAGVYHVVNEARVTDALAALTLNNSRLLHTRLHWRPEALTDLKAYNEKKMNEYSIRSAAMLGEIEVSVLEEVAEKSEMIWDELERQLGARIMSELEARLRPMITYAAVEAQKIVVRNYNSYLMPVSAMASSTASQLQYTSFKPQALINKLPSMPSFKFNMFMEKPSAKIEAVKQAILPRSNSSKWDSYVDVLISVLEKEIDLALKDLAEIDSDYEVTVWDPEHGEIQVELHLPLPLAALDELPVVNVEKYLRQMRQAVPSTSEFDTEMLTGEWMPPFTGVASVKSGHQITTFDGYVYDLPLDCTFVLARDYTDGNFSLVLSNEGETTLTLMSQGPTVQIGISGKITVAGKELEALPFAMKALKIDRESNETMKITLGDHLTVHYDLSIDHVTVSLSGWYHGKTGGLLGTFDNEPSNDLMTSFGKVNTNQARFAKTWAVGRAAC